MIRMLIRQAWASPARPAPNLVAKCVAVYLRLHDHNIDDTPGTVVQAPPLSTSIKPLRGRQGAEASGGPASGSWSTTMRGLRRKTIRKYMIINKEQSYHSTGLMGVFARDVAQVYAVVRSPCLTLPNDGGLFSVRRGPVVATSPLFVNGCSMKCTLWSKTPGWVMISAVSPDMNRRLMPG